MLCIGTGRIPQRRRQEEKEKRAEKDTLVMKNNDGETPEVTTNDQNI